MVAQPSARERLLDAAEHLAFTQGVAATPVDVILKQANVAPATLYAHFGNKEGLIVEALRRRLTRWDQDWQLEVDAATTAQEKLLAVFPALSRYRSGPATARWCAFLSVAAESPHPSQLLDEALRSDTELLIERLHELAVPVVGIGEAQGLAERLALILTGVLGMMLRAADPDKVIADGHATAKTIIEATAVSTTP
ncbi:TetR/AcrR family transcriptional regulator [Arthrobacter burdickii]|uniref:TetR/AcrR family transcriptional regulator n=1 Tax=Arthrobacter burdickii TaxID=3035920 RepID=A0ABT8K916_9MICC|nr:TetR/AcrR family transcriptional regulator [Arthrobacter burdickii]MDN4612809.1 TetR/AcrR family transcriptional regulator [Arthrobacter burdickii]